MSDSPDPATLQALFARAVSDPVARAQLARQVFPDAEVIRAALVDEASDARRALEQAYARMRPADDAGDAAWAKILDMPADRTNIQVHGATAADLIAAIPGTPAANEFPGAVRPLAPLLRPDLTFYEVTAVAPGASSGSRFHLFFAYEGGWRMLGPVWRVLRGGA